VNARHVLIKQPHGLGLGLRNWNSGGVVSHQRGDDAVGLRRGRWDLEGRGVAPRHGGALGPTQRGGGSENGDPWWPQREQNRGGGADLRRGQKSR
jgi:hypothetical protein